jgi:uncharacterized protein (DUF1800 family)
LSGWTYCASQQRGTTSLTARSVDFSKALDGLRPTRYDTGAKTFLGRTVAANATQHVSVDAVVDAVFNHPNTGPYVCKRLIQQLTVANPTPAYVSRVAAAFRQQRLGRARRHEGRYPGHLSGRRGARRSRSCPGR